MDGVDTDVTTKPALIIYDHVPGDSDGDRDVDIVDYAALADCRTGPNLRASTSCAVFDLDADFDVDFRDFQRFEERMTASGH